MLLAGVSHRLGEPEEAVRLLQRRSMVDYVAILARLDADLHGLLSLEPLAPRKLDAVLVWPLEAPAIDAARHALFREVRIESGLPQGSDVLGSG
jgi:hypothetical protein